MALKQYKAAFVPKKGKIKHHQGTIQEIEQWIDSKFDSMAVMFRTEFKPINLLEKGKLVGVGYECADLFATVNFKCIAIPLDTYEAHFKSISISGLYYAATQK